MVGGHPAPRVGRVVRRVPGRGGAGSGTVAGAVRRLRGVAAAVADRRRPRSAATLLAQPVGGCAAAGAAERPSAARGPVHRRCGDRVLGTGPGRRRSARRHPRCRGVDVHDGVRGVHRAARPLLRPGRHCGGYPDREPYQGRDRGPHRLLRQHPGAAHRPVRRPHLHGTARPGPGRDH